MICFVLDLLVTDRRSDNLMKSSQRLLRQLAHPIELLCFVITIFIVFKQKMAVILLRFLNGYVFYFRFLVRFIAEH